MKTWTVYKHVSPSGKVYVGITSNIHRRWAANGYYYCLKETAFSRALYKYGWDNFQHIIVATELTKQEASDMEKTLIKKYKELSLSYNITDGGEGYAGHNTKEHIKNRVKSRTLHSQIDYVVIDNDFNYIVYQTTSEVAAQLGTTNNVVNHVLSSPIGYSCKKHYIWKHKKGTPVNIDYIKSCILTALEVRKERKSLHAKTIIDKLVRASLKERESLSCEERKERYTSHGMQGKHHTEDTKKRMSILKQGINPSQETIEEAKAKNQRAIEAFVNNDWKRYNSIKEASEELGINKANISAVCKGRRKSAGTLKFRYYVS